MNTLGCQHFSPKHKIPYSICPNNPIEYGNQLDEVYDQAEQDSGGHNISEVVEAVCRYMGIMMYKIHKNIIAYKIVSWQNEFKS